MDVNAKTGPLDSYKGADGDVTDARVFHAPTTTLKGITAISIGKVIQSIKSEGALDCGRYVVLSKLVQYMREHYDSKGCVDCVFKLDYLSNMGAETILELSHKSKSAKRFGELSQFAVKVTFQAQRRDGKKVMEYDMEVVPENGIARYLYVTKKYAMSIYNSESAMNIVKQAIGVALKLFFPKLAIAAGLSSELAIAAGLSSEL